MISKKFTIEDIHKIRYANYEANKGLNSEQIIEKTQHEAEEVIRIIDELKKSRK